MAWVINGIYKQEKDEVVTGVRVEWNNGEPEEIEVVVGQEPVPDTDPVEYQDVMGMVPNPEFLRESKTWGRGDMSVQELKIMLIGAGTLQSPLGELKAWTDHYNSTEITESPMT